MINFVSSEIVEDSHTPEQQEEDDDEEEEDELAEVRIYRVWIEVFFW